MSTLEFLFDFGSPNAYLVHRVLPAFAKRTGVRVSYKPVLIGGIFKATNNQPPMLAFAPVKGKLAYERLELKRFVERHQIPFEMNPHFPVNTLQIMRGAIAAQQSAQFDDYVELMMTHMWQTPQKLDDPAVIEKVLTDGGLDAQAIMTKASDPQVKQALADNTADAVERGVFGLPSFFLGQELWYGKERLDDIERVLAAG
ncbi:MAG: 2-hydroxychromene-2-carboxylate isomerase [Burkholderiaceae bacterium]